MRRCPVGLLVAALAIAAPALADVSSDDAEAARANRLAEQEAERTAVRNAWYTDVQRDLRARTDARSRALSTTWPAAPGEEADRRKLLASLVPYDPLVQWIVAVRAFNPLDTNLVTTAIDRLERIEPDNAAVWEFAFEVAIGRNDATGAEIAFDRMATSTRSDDHYVDLIHLWLAIFDSHPAPAMLFDSPAETAASPLTYAIGHAAPMRYPTYTPLQKYCSVAATGSDRARRCIAIGHLMADHSTSVGGRNIGLGLLKQGEELNRESWIEMHREAATGFDPKDLARVQAYVTDWRELDDEHLIVERALRRAGIPASPPPGWEIPPLETTLL